MTLLWEGLAAVGAVLLGVAAGLLLEELMLGGLARLVLAQRSDTGKQKEQRNLRGDRK
jgi:hypothetical protein